MPRRRGPIAAGIPVKMAQAPAATAGRGVAGGGASVSARPPLESPVWRPRGICRNEGGDACSATIPILAGLGALAGGVCPPATRTPGRARGDVVAAISVEVRHGDDDLDAVDPALGLDARERLRLRGARDPAADERGGDALLRHVVLFRVIAARGYYSRGPLPSTARSGHLRPRGASEGFGSTGHSRRPFRVLRRRPWYTAPAASNTDELHGTRSRLYCHRPIEGGYVGPSKGSALLYLPLEG